MNCYHCDARGDYPMRDGGLRLCAKCWGLTLVGTQEKVNVGPEPKPNYEATAIQLTFSGQPSTGLCYPHPPPRPAWYWNVATGYFQTE